MSSGYVDQLQRMIRYFKAAIVNLETAPHPEARARKVALHLRKTLAKYQRGRRYHARYLRRASRG